MKRGTGKKIILLAVLLAGKYNGFECPPRVRWA